MRGDLWDAEGTTLHSCPECGEECDCAGGQRGEAALGCEHCCLMHDDKDRRRER